MKAECEDTQLEATYKPQIFLKSITFNDSTQLPLKRNSIIVFTGANNSGKSQVLKDVENRLNPNDESPTIVIKDAQYDYCGTIDEITFLKDFFFLNRQGYYQPFESGNSYGNTA